MDEGVDLQAQLAGTQNFYCFTQQTWNQLIGPISLSYRGLLPFLKHQVHQPWEVRFVGKVPKAQEEQAFTFSFQFGSDEGQFLVHSDEWPHSRFLVVKKFQEDLKLFKVRPFFLGKWLELIKAQNLFHSRYEVLLLLAFGGEFEEIDADFDEEMNCLASLPSLQARQAVVLKILSQHKY